MTYANDCIHERQRGLKRIEDHTGKELNVAINEAVRKHGDDFWLLLHGIDAYMERRKRRAQRMRMFDARELRDELDVWGNS